MSQTTFDLIASVVISLALDVAVFYVARMIRNLRKSIDVVARSAANLLQGASNLVEAAETLHKTTGLISESIRPAPLAGHPGNLPKLAPKAALSMSWTPGRFTVDQTAVCGLCYCTDEPLAHGGHCHHHRTNFAPGTLMCHYGRGA